MYSDNPTFEGISRDAGNFWTRAEQYWQTPLWIHWALNWLSRPHDSGYLLSASWIQQWAYYLGAQFDPRPGIWLLLCPKVFLQRFKKLYEKKMS